jgi:uncharacterized protein YraI
MKRMMYSLAALVLCAPLAAQAAAEGWVVDDISLQAGPDPSYPSIVELNAGTPVSIQGCVNGWTWCDVIAGADRGWVPGTFLEEDVGGQRVVVIDNGPRIGIPIVNFSLGLYWDQHYHNRPFYTQREQWVSRAIQPSQPPRPAKAVARAQSGAAATSTQQSAATTSQQSAATTTQQRTRTQQQMSTAQQQQTQTPQQQTQTPKQQTQTAQQSRTTQSKMTARATPPKRPETTVPETQKPSQASQAEKRESAQAPTTVANAKARAGEPKPKDELKKPKPKDDKTDQGDKDGEH